MKLGNYLLLLDGSDKVVRVSLAIEQATEEGQAQQWKDDFDKIKSDLSEKKPLVLTLWERDPFFGLGEPHEQEDESIFSDSCGIIGTIEDLSDFLRRSVKPAPSGEGERFDTQFDLTTYMPGSVSGGNNCTKDGEVNSIEDEKG